MYFYCCVCTTTDLSQGAGRTSQQPRYVTCDADTHAGDEVDGDNDDDDDDGDDDNDDGDNDNDNDGGDDDDGTTDGGEGEGEIFMSRAKAELVVRRTFFCPNPNPTGVLLILEYIL